MNPPAPASDVARVAGEFGLLLADGAPVTEGEVEPGTIRIVASRASAHVAGLPELDRSGHRIRRSGPAPITAARSTPTSPR